MANSYFRFKQFIVQQDKAAMKVSTDSCLFGAWSASRLQGEAKGKILDVGTGTGLLSLMLAQKAGHYIEAVELDAEAAEQAEENIKASKWSDRITVFHENILSFKGSGYDQVISNPPFYENDLPSSSNQKNRAHHSSDLKIEELLALSFSKTTATGSCFLLLPFRRKDEIEKLISKENWFIDSSVLVKQSPTHPYFRWMVCLKKEPIKMKEEQLIIWNDNKQYTPEFKELLKDYYLYL